jgi:hypothetical protein
MILIRTEVVAYEVRAHGRSVGSGAVGWHLSEGWSGCVPVVLGVGLISVARVPVEIRCCSRAPRVSFSQVIDCGYVPVPRKTLEFPEKSSVNEVVFETEWRRDSCRKNGSCVTNGNLRKIRRFRTSHSIILGIPNRHFWRANQGEAEQARVTQRMHR